MEAQLRLWQAGTPAAELQTGTWSSHEWLHFLRALPENISANQLEALDQAYGFTESGNAELLAQWLLLAVKADYPPAAPALEEFLTHVGRRKFLVPLYTALLQTPAGTQKAQQISSVPAPTTMPLQRARLPAC
ncbi:leukotriene A4 hydrolase C-terminal domain-containing protein [Rufibacter ruber]|uniref:leukotriene A4 hydrolase C-terminal domain-containing protein n=1 Tax=Rufibacter ruber TaxID=1783499 RepID=UPI001F4E8A7C|nr:leukotriene A4 hydrolase C-terminal domain-containing protein [Rufibacter ruber]